MSGSLRRRALLIGNAIYRDDHWTRLTSARADRHELAKAAPGSTRPPTRRVLAWTRDLADPRLHDALSEAEPLTAPPRSAAAPGTSPPVGRYVTTDSTQRRSARERTHDWFVRAAQEAATEDPAVAGAFAEVMLKLAAPRHLARPDLIARIVTRRRRLRSAGG